MMMMMMMNFELRCCYRTERDGKGRIYWVSWLLSWLDEEGGRREEGGGKEGGKEEGGGKRECKCFVWLCLVMMTG